MIPENVVNPAKKEKIKGFVFHLYYMDLNTSILFDRDLSEPIIFGSKMVVMTHLKKINEIMGVKPDVKVWIFSYMLDTQGYRRIDTYHGPISTIGKYIKRF